MPQPWLDPSQLFRFHRHINSKDLPSVNFYPLPYLNPVRPQLSVDKQGSFNQKRHL
jgi:hypothetical protein